MADTKTAYLELARTSPNVVRILDHATHKEVRASDVYFVEGGRAWLRQGGKFKQNEALPQTSKKDIEAIHAWVGGSHESAARTFYAPVPERWRISTGRTKSGLTATCQLLAATPQSAK